MGDCHRSGRLWFNFLPSIYLRGLSEALSAFLDTALTWYHAVDFIRSEMETKQECPFHPNTPPHRGFAFLIYLFILASLWSAALPSGQL